MAMARLPVLLVQPLNAATTTTTTTTNASATSATSSAATRTDSTEDSNCVVSSGPHCEASRLV